ncbi:aldose 1-epimerase family protein [Aquimarina sp. AU474]|uniref:aldose 1-epimerase family protein n=1 Tax=Aquimarina sp. AU474 TaxID=2108529 RepID=UPI000D68F6CC|nr:aldose 1-epimerase family protein [Aquimarina sp. AU474]
MYILENDTLKVTVNPIGAELSSIIKKSNQKEYLWQGDPEIWGSQAPVLFPIIGGLKNNSYLFEGKEYTMPKHGFIRYNKDLVASQSKNKISFTLFSSPKTLLVYPFDFVFTIDFELLENQIIVSHTIQNTGHQKMYFSIGGHPAFNCPINQSHSYEDYYISFKEGKGTPSYVLSPNGLISDDTISVFDDDKIYLTSDIFNNDALIFKNIHAKEATLCHKTNGEIISISFPDFSDLGIWAKPKAPFVCIEPWFGYADIVDTDQLLITKKGIQGLNEDAIHKSRYQIEIL